MATVRTSGILGLSREVRSVVSILRTTAAKTSSNCSNIVKCAATLDGYNNQIVAGSVVNTREYDGEYISTYKEYKKWIITTNDIASTANTLASLSEEVCDTVEKIFAEATNMDEIAVALEQYISSVEATLGDNISETALATAFGAIGMKGITKANVATSGEDVKKRNFIDFDKFMKDSNLSSSKLTFEKQEDGSYLIKKDGQSTGYYTTGLAAAFYMKTLKRTIETENATIATVPTREQMEQQKKESLDNTDDVLELEEVEPEDNITVPTREQMEQQKKTDTTSLIKNRQDIIVPNGEHLYINGKKTIGTSMTFRFNADTGKYHSITSDGEFSQVSYTLYEMSQAEIK